MKVLVTGAGGFVGKNLCQRLSREKDIEVLTFDVENSPEELSIFLSLADAIVHLAGINRPLDPADFMSGNYDLTSTIVGALERAGRAIPLVFSSSIQAEAENDYGRSKKAAEERLREYAGRTGAKVSIFRFANVFGKWCRPNYNSAVATFCHNIAHDLPITVNNAASPLRLIYVDDAVDAILRELRAEGSGFSFSEATPLYETTVGQVADTLRLIHDARHTGRLYDFSDPLFRKLNATYLSYVDLPDLATFPEMKRDERGWLFELIKSAAAGQIFVSTTRPGKGRGNHYHDTKVEKFCLVKGQARISFRKVGTEERFNIDVDDTAVKVVDIPPGYTHALENTGKDDCIVLFWASEIFDPSHPDTYYLEV